MPTARLKVAYDGSRFAGWSAQPGQRTVQAEIESAIERIVGELVELTVAGRTDSGVHALGQAASFIHSRELPDRPAERLNAVLSHDVAVLELEPAADDFDARHSATARIYRYRVLASGLRDPFEERRALWWRQPLDRELLDRAAAAVVGNHDFTAFTPTQTEHVLFERTVDRCEWREQRPGLLAMEIAAKSFMRNQVRALVGTMLEVGGGRRPLEDFERLLAGAPRDDAGETAPAHGLYLVEVRY
ncbi:MAG: tRNA pseudouridine(38-40) synthase TruA [Solirubrobacterales bacterium]